MKKEQQLKCFFPQQNSKKDPHFFRYFGGKKLGLLCHSSDAARKPYLEEKCLETSTVFSLFFIQHGKQDMPCRYSLVGQPLVATNQPDKNVWNAMLGLKRRPRIEEITFRIWTSFCLAWVTVLKSGHVRHEAVGNSYIQYYYMVIPEGHAPSILSFISWNACVLLKSIYFWNNGEIHCGGICAWKIVLRFCLLLEEKCALSQW